MGRRLWLHYRRLAALLLAATVLYSELLCYWQARLGWPAPPPAPNTAILLVADPQLVGYSQEPPGLAGTVYRWDSDRYLSQALHPTFLRHRTERRSDRYCKHANKCN